MANRADPDGRDETNRNCRWTAKGSTLLRSSHAVSQIWPCEVCRASHGARKRPVLFHPVRHCTLSWKDPDLAASAQLRPSGVSRVNRRRDTAGLDSRIRPKIAPAQACRPAPPQRRARAHNHRKAHNIPEEAAELHKPAGQPTPLRSAHPRSSRLQYRQQSGRSPLSSP